LALEVQVLQLEYFWSCSSIHVVLDSLPFEFLGLEQAFEFWISFELTTSGILEMEKIDSNCMAMRKFPNVLESEVHQALSSANIDCRHVLQNNFGHVGSSRRLNWSRILVEDDESSNCFGIKALLTWRSKHHNGEIVAIQRICDKLGKWCKRLTLCCIQSAKVSRYFICIIVFMQRPALEAHFRIVNFLSGCWLRWRRRLGLHFLLGYDRWLPNWSWFCNRHWCCFNLRSSWNLLRCFFYFFYRFFLLLGGFLLMNGPIINWLCLNINNILINGLLASIFYGAIFILNLHKAWTWWDKLIHLLKHRVDLHLGGFNNLVSYSFLHQINLALPDDLHQLVL